MSRNHCPSFCANIIFSSETKYDIRLSEVQELLETKFEHDLCIVCYASLIWFDSLKF